MQRHGGTGGGGGAGRRGPSLQLGLAGRGPRKAVLTEAAEGLPQRRDTLALTPRKYVNVHSMTDSMRQVPGGGATGHGRAWPSDP